MLAPVYLLNLSRSEGLKAAPGLFEKHKIIPPRTTDYLECIPDADPLIVYVIGHALPDTFWNGHTPVPDDVLKDQIREARDGKKTLIIWDACFSMSVLTPGPSPVDGKDPQLGRKARSFWGRDTVHLFSCQSYERTWHLGDKDNRVTLFSQQLKVCLQELPAQGRWNWEILDKQLAQRFGSLQQPQTVQVKEGPEPRDFFTA